MPLMKHGWFKSNAKYFWRQKWTVVMVISIVFFTTLLMRSFPPPQRDNYHDEELPEIYAEAMLKWFNYSGPQRWYNTETVGMFDDQMLRLLRSYWIVHNTESFTYSKEELSTMRDPSMGQAKDIRNYFENKTNGFFIECGAYDGETRSNTWILEKQLNWTGILIEADPINFTKMLGKKRRAYMSPTCLSVKKHPMNVSFLMAENIGRIHKPNEDKELNLENTLDRAYDGQHVGVQCFPLASYIAALGIKTVDYFSLDIEGSELDVLATIPFDIVDITTLSVEFSHGDGGSEKLMDFMDKKGYYPYSLVTNKQNLANDVIFVKRKPS